MSSWTMSSSSSLPRPAPNLATGSLVLLVLVAIVPSTSSEYHEGVGVGGGSSLSGSSSVFSFADEGENLTVQVGATAYLHCPVYHLGERQVSWVRLRDWHILTHGAKTFTSDDRFALVRGNGEANANANANSNDHAVDDWTLQIKYVVARDSGVYECQVSGDDGAMAGRRADLRVVTPEAYILSEEEFHIHRGSALSLMCIIEKATTPPQYVFWYHNARMVNYDVDRGVSVSTTPGRKTHSTLLIKRAEVADSGNYTCAPSNSLPASVQVFVSGSEVKPWTTGGCWAVSVNVAFVVGLAFVAVAAVSHLGQNSAFIGL